MISLVHLDNAVNLSDEPEAGDEADGATEYEDQEDHDEAVSEVERGADECSDSHLRLEIVDAVEEEIEGRGSRGEERSPPPVIVL